MTEKPRRTEGTPAERLRVLADVIATTRARTRPEAAAEMLARWEWEARAVATELRQRETVERLARGALDALARQQAADDEALARVLGEDAQAELAGPHGPVRAAKRIAESDALTWANMKQEVQRLLLLAERPLPERASRMERFSAFTFALAVARVEQLQNLLAGLFGGLAEAKNLHDQRTDALPDCISSGATANALAEFVSGFADLRRSGLHWPAHRLATLCSDGANGLPVRFSGVPIPLGGRPGLTTEEASRRGLLAVALDALHRAHPHEEIQKVAQHLAERVNVPPHQPVTWQQVKKWRKGCMAAATGGVTSVHPEQLARWQAWRDQLAVRPGFSTESSRRTSEELIRLLRDEPSSGIRGGQAESTHPPCFRTRDTGSD